jgi:L-amino acid N-acyltransferase YncA
MPIRIRPAVLYRDGAYDGADMGVMYECRNDEDARRFSGNKQSITWEEHKRWFQRELRDRPEGLWIGEVDGVAVGYVRQKLRANNRSLISVALLRTFRGRGFGVELLKAMVRMIVAEGRVPVAHVMFANTVSAKAFLSAGFKQVKILNGDFGVESRAAIYEWQPNGRKYEERPMHDSSTGKHRGDQLE